MFERFCADEVDHVRQSVSLSLPVLCGRIDSSDYRRVFAVKAVQALADSGDDVRFAALEILGEIIFIFEKDPRGPPIELLKLYLDHGDDESYEQESDWDVVASYNVGVQDADVIAQG